MNTTNKPDLDNLEMHMPEGDALIPEPETKQRITNGPILILLVLLLLVILGGMYWWYVTKLQTPAITSETVRPTAEENNEPESTTAEAQTQTFQTMSNSDNLGSIEADLESTNLDSLDTEITAIESELDNTN